MRGKYYAIDTSDELKHFKYVKRYRGKNGTWNYVYADKNTHNELNKKKKKWESAYETRKKAYGNESKREKQLIERYTTYSSPWPDHYRVIDLPEYSKRRKVLKDYTDSTLDKEYIAFNDLANSSYNVSLNKKIKNLKSKVSDKTSKSKNKVSKATSKVKKALNNAKKKSKVIIRKLKTIKIKTK